MSLVCSSEQMLQSSRCFQFVKGLWIHCESFIFQGFNRLQFELCEPIFLGFLFCLLDALQGPCVCIAQRLELFLHSLQSVLIFTRVRLHFSGFFRKNIEFWLYLWHIFPRDFVNFHLALVP